MTFFCLFSVIYQSLGTNYTEYIALEVAELQYLFIRR